MNNGISGSVSSMVLLNRWKVNRFPFVRDSMMHLEKKLKCHRNATREQIATSEQLPILLKRERERTDKYLTENV